MPKYLIIFSLFFVLSGCQTNDNNAVVTGDLVFQLNADSDMSQAISAVTQGKDGINYTHVGIAKEENGHIYIIEATPPTVTKTLWSDFVARSAQINGRAVVMVGRVKEPYRYTIARAVEYAELQIGKPYDMAFGTDTTAYYCSELVCRSFVDSLGEELFESYPMNFRTPEGVLPQQWIEHFANLSLPIPEGENGSNPAQQSRSPKIEQIFSLLD